MVKFDKKELEKIYQKITSDLEDMFGDNNDMRYALRNEYDSLKWNLFIYFHNLYELNNQKINETQKEIYFDNYKDMLITNLIQFFDKTTELIYKWNDEDDADDEFYECYHLLNEDTVCEIRDELYYLIKERFWKIKNNIFILD